ncbi:hypothetical protein RE474_13310 [Methanolobus sediminis]|uniref:Uncharacterized protein n=1 Tax=Methanolobus sediminis TaxID=3072978 RepID=A0AA51UN23_9EURY|nr:hypothetical protein [Methanolobus sediminis]WMW25040.1 hypothetical protein RE474_13310 [Methanolobus sediminis]
MTDGDVTDNNKKGNDTNKLQCRYCIVLMTILLMLAGGTLYYFSTNSRASEILLCILLSISVIALLLALTFAASIFKCLGMNSPKEALGLPKGSVRAIIALSLILIFMISSVFFFTQLSYPRLTNEIDFSQAEYDNLSKESIFYSYPHYVNATNETRYNVMLKKEPNKDSVDIAKQIITTISTLVVAVAGFYFGTKSVSIASEAATGKEIETGPDPLIRDIGPKEGKQDESIPNFTITGKNLEAIKEVRLDHIEKDYSMKFGAESIMLNPTKVIFTLKIPTDAPIDKYNVVVVNDEQVEDCFKAAFKVKNKED